MLGVDRWNRLLKLNNHRCDFCWSVIAVCEAHRPENLVHGPEQNRHWMSPKQALASALGCSRNRVLNAAKAGGAHLADRMRENLERFGGAQGTGRILVC